jgi:hypothetical protein
MIVWSKGNESEISGSHGGEYEDGSSLNVFDDGAELITGVFFFLGGGLYPSPCVLKTTTFQVMVLPPVLS